MGGFRTRFERAIYYWMYGARWVVEVGFSTRNEVGGWVGRWVGSLTRDGLDVIHVEAALGLQAIARHVDGGVGRQVDFRGHHAGEGERA